MNYSHIDLILAIADAGSITDAAENLFVSKPFLSSALKSIESEIGTPLFKRSRSGTELTPFGHEYVQYARQIADELEFLRNLYKSREVPQLRLDVISMGFSFLPAMFAEIREKYKDFPCVFQLIEGSLRSQIKVITSGQCEVGVVAVDEFTKRQALGKIKASGLEYTKLQDIKSGIYVSPDSKYFPANKEFLNEETIKYLLDMPYIGLFAGPEQMRLSEYWPALDSLVKGRHSRYVASTNGLRTQMINEYDGFGTAAYCASLYERYSFKENLRFIPFAPEVSFKYELGWIQRDNQPRSLLANELFRLLRE